MSFVTCLDWKISSSIFVQSCHFVSIQFIYKPMKIFDVHWQISRSIESSLMLITFAATDTLIVTSIQVHIHWSIMNMWATIFRMNYSPMFEMFRCMMNDRSNIHFSFACRNHFRQWERCPWRMKQHKRISNINSRAMRMNLFQRLDTLLCGLFFFSVFMMIMSNKSSSQRKRFSPMTCMWAFILVNWNAWRMISCETKHESTIPKWNRSTSMMKSTGQNVSELSLLRLK